MESSLPQATGKRCPQCGANLPAEEDQTTCPYCGTDLRRARPPEPVGPVQVVLPGVATLSPAVLQRMYGYEYRSQATLLGLPLVHIAQGIDLQTGRARVARGIIAIGNVAFGVLAVGGAAFGGIAIGGFACGLFAMAGIALGVISLGGMSLALFLALGGMAISLQYAIGGLALAPHALGGNVQDPEMLRWLESLLGPRTIE